MPETGSDRAGTRWRGLSRAALGGLLGGVVGGFFVVAVTLVLKLGLDTVSALPTWQILVIPLLGLAVSVLVLQVYGRSERASAWRTFPRDAVRADITGDLVDHAGQEDRFPWRLAPIRAVAILATVGSGAGMGTEAPAAYLGVATGSWLGDRGRRWRELLRPAAVGGGAAGVAALMGVALVGTFYILEIGQRNRAPYSAERVTAALVGGLVGWGIDVAFRLDLIRLIVPREPPRSLLQAVVTVLFIGVVSGGITSLAAWAIYRAKQWQARPLVRLLVGGLAALATAWLLVEIAAPSAAVGPGGGTILWAENTPALPLTLLAVCLLRAAATTAAVAAGGCGGVFVPFLAIGDIGGRVFVPGLSIGADLAGAAGAAGGIAGGYRLPLAAAAMVLGIGGPPLGMLTCLATVGVAFLAGMATDGVIERIGRLSLFARRAPAH